MDRIISSLNQNPAGVSSLASYFNSEKLQTDDEYRDKAFYLASSIPSALHLLINFGLQSPNFETQLRAVFAAGTVTDPTPELLNNMRQLSFSDGFISNTALMALGTLIRASGKSGEELVTRLTHTNTSDDMVAILYAIRNAGPNSVPLSVLPANVFVNEDVEVQDALKDVLGGYSVNVTQLERIDSSFPFSKSWDKSIYLGGTAAGGEFAGELFLGTNFDCKQQDFNYKALAHAHADLKLFGTIHFDHYLPSQVTPSKLSWLKLFTGAKTAWL